MPVSKAPTDRPKSSKELSEELSKGEFKPSDYMRARRPELFSDSKVESESLLGRELFEYHLETLTSRKEETKFEHFAQRLCEHEICPNLLPQTGPTGGGDSKTDSETYPVAQTIAQRWYEGINPVESAEQKWGFAFSAMKKWRQKAISDVAKIAGTKRGHSHVYFITNQFVKDNVRAALEAELKFKHGFEVHILDRTWIVKCVLEHRRIELAIETLGLDTELRPRKLTGSRDLANERRLEQLEKEINDPLRYGGAQYHLAEDCLQAALLARGLELPRIDVDARFQRAQRIAEQINHSQQLLLRISYNRAWTCFWWYDDLQEFLRHYTVVEGFALDSPSAEDLQRLINLWQLLNSSCVSGKLDATECQLHERTKALTDSLEKMAQDRARINNAHEARTGLILVRLAVGPHDASTVGARLLELRDAIKQARGLISYAFEPLPKIVQEIGNAFTDLPEYDELLEEATSTAKERLGNQEAGRMLLARGIQKLRANRPYDAIVYFGRAQQLLAMRESRWEISESLFMCGTAYEAGALFWASRANVLASLNQILGDFWDLGSIEPQAVLCAQKLAWIEIQLGRIAGVISWIELADLLARGLKLADADIERFTEARWNQDATLGILFLRAKQEDLRFLQYLPDTLKRLDLEISRMALLYSLGYEDQLRSEGLIPEGQTSEQVQEFFLLWLNQPAAADLPENLVGTAGKMTFSSSILGCRLKFVVEDDDESIFLSERFLGAMEALLSTSLSEDVYPYREEYIVRVERSNKVEGTPELEIHQDEGISVLRHNGTILTPGDRDATWFFEAIAQLISQIIFLDDTEGYLHRVFGEQGGLFRALNFTETSVPVSNIYGASSKLRLADWNTEGKPAAYITKRIVPWHDGLVPIKARETYSMRKMGSGEPPSELFDRSARKHTSRQVSSLINQALWDKAKWKGVAYIWSPDPDEPPALALAFQNGDAGKKIFKELIAKLGAEDEQDRLRISIITGVSKDFPDKYAVIVGSNLPSGGAGGNGREIVSLSRVHRMELTNPRNLKVFQERFAQVGTFRFLAASWSLGQAHPILHHEAMITKKLIRIIPAWQLGENDIDSIAIGPDDDPIIPPTISDAPVLRLLQRRARRRSKS